MKIAYVSDFYLPAISGVARVVQELAERYVKQGHEVHVFCPDWDKERRVKPKEEIINGVHIHRCFHILRIANFATIWPSVFFRLMNDDFDIIHSHLFGHLHFFLASLVSIIKNIPHIHTTHCPWSDAYRSVPGRIGLWFSYNLFSRAVMRFIDKIIAITPWEIDFIKKYGGKDDQIIVIPNGADNIYFHKLKSNDFKKKFGIKNKFVLFFGRFNVTKSPLDFVKIAKTILSKRKDLDFVMVGPDEGELSKTIASAKRIRQIHILGPIRDKKVIQKMYRASEVYVLPSYREGLPLTLFEAYASGLPVVATPVNGVPYELKDGINGFLVPHGDIESFAEKIMRIIDDNALHSKFSKNNSKKAKNYSWDSIAKRTMIVYKRVISDRRKND